MNRFGPPYTKPLAIAVGLGVALAVAFSVPWKLNFARGWIEQRALAATGRALQLEGDVWWRWGRVGQLSVDRLRFANPSWAGRPDMVTAERVEIGIALWPLRKGAVELHTVRASRPDLWLEKKGDRHNWYLDPQQSDGSSSVTVIGPLKIDEGRVQYVDVASKTQIALAVQTDSADGRQRLAIDAQGRLEGLALKADAKVDDLLALRATGADALPYRFELDASLGGTQLNARGELSTPMKPTAADVRVRLQGRSLGEIYRITGVGLPDSPPYRTEGRVRFDGEKWVYEDFTSVIGRSDLGGRIAFEPRDARQAGRPLISAKLVSRSLDLRDFGPSLGRSASQGAPVAASEPAAAASKPGRVLPQEPFDASRWNSLDADVQFKGASVRNVGSFPLDDLNFQLFLQDRRLRIESLSLRAGGGTVSGRLGIDGAVQPMAAQLDAQWRGLKLDELLPKLQTTRSALGTLNGRAKLSGQGNSFAQLLGTANGEAQLAMGRGRMSNLLVELLDLDAFEAVSFLVRGDRDVMVRCAVIDSAFERGRMTPRTAVFDTDDTFIHATGHVDFAKELIDLRVTPLPKDMSPLTARVPIDIGGSFAAPQVMPDRARLAARGGTALLLGLINPLAALIPLIETGPGEDADCAGLTALARKEGVPVSSTGAAQPIQNK